MFYVRDREIPKLHKRLKIINYLNMKLSSLIFEIKKLRSYVDNIESSKTEGSSNRLTFKNPNLAEKLEKESKAVRDIR